MSEPIFTLPLRCPECDRVISEIPMHIDEAGNAVNSVTIGQDDLICPDHGVLAHGVVDAVRGYLPVSPQEPR